MSSSDSSSTPPPPAFRPQRRLHAGFYPTAAELEFLAEDTPVSIIPRFSSDGESLICADIGPFEAGVPAIVPLWIAVELKQLQKCNIQTPTWLEKDFLTTKLKAERDSTVFTELHPRYLEIATMLLNVADDDIEDATLLRTILE